MDTTSDPLADILIGVVPTPNPDALMFKVEESLVPTGTYEYNRGDDTSTSPLAEQIVNIPGVALILIAPRFVTVRKDSDVGWPDIVPIVKDTLRRFLYAGEIAVLDSAMLGTHTAASDTEEKLIQLIDDEIRPALAMDGGDVTYMGFEDGIVKLQLIGACGTCPSAVTTLKMGIERLLMAELPQVKAVENV